MKKVLSIALSVLMIVGVMPPVSFMAFAAEPTNGSCGSNATYSFDSVTGTLSISGTGAIEDYTTDSPFNMNESVINIEVGEGITRIGNYAFYDCEGL